MNSKSGKRGVGIVLLLFAAVSAIYAGVREYRADSAAGVASTQKEQGHKVIAYYFHTTGRCTTCKSIEAYSLQAIKTQFGGALDKGSLVWRVLNVDEAENAHFIQDFQLTTKSVVLVEMEDGVQKRWKNLDRIWHEIGNPDQFQEYVQKEVAEFGGKLL
ncbi:MAG TPA: hypothetical protein DCS07_08910 [Bdellovibrionales bacterium]|nr:MAG: hypothetical protein A2Z97_11515 [Bdellovibrionales bacterium GWB1_52_6]OFZ03898.1 MAG: hypothetical protein A2X97_16000 [Bdellovibrionales bacterium GWA1_52_35]HAR42730.1 hypothetical protein [Bdellovibrionales bacterium]HCM39664.1 hypothetical protein [Bdellovibrionales bacterium]